MDKKKILILPGDGIGSEAVDEVKKIIDIFPNLKLICHGGVNFEPYQNQFKELLDQFDQSWHKSVAKILG